MCHLHPEPMQRTSGVGSCYLPQSPHGSLEAPRGWSPARLDGLYSLRNAGMWSITFPTQKDKTVKIVCVCMHGVTQSEAGYRSRPHPRPLRNRSARGRSSAHCVHTIPSRGFARNRRIIPHSCRSWPGGLHIQYNQRWLFTFSAYTIGTNSICPRSGIMIKRGLRDRGTWRE